MDTTNLKTLYAKLNNEGYLQNQNPDDPNSYIQGCIVCDSSGNAMFGISPNGKKFEFKGNPYEMSYKNTNGKYSFVGDTATYRNTLYDESGNHYSVYSTEYDY